MKITHTPKRINVLLYSIFALLTIFIILLLAFYFAKTSHAEEGTNLPPETALADIQKGGAGGGGGTGGGGIGGGGGGGGGGDGEEEPEQGNNLSFPAILADGFSVTPIASTTFSSPYEGPYTGLSPEEITNLGSGLWYAQKTVGNTWQAEYQTSETGDSIPVYGIDWGDNIEAVNPIVNNPFRIEVSFYHKPNLPMTGYTMALLRNPSSPDEVQGTNGETYESDFASVVSNQPKLIIQDITGICATDMAWSDGKWVLNDNPLLANTPTFAPELNVGGKYIYGASKGGWRPKTEGMYRVTVSLPQSDISLEQAVIGNYADWSSLTTEKTEEGEEGEETGVATPKIDSANNLTYVDVTVVAGHSGRAPGDTSLATENPCLNETGTTTATTTPGTIDTGTTTPTSTPGTVEPPADTDNTSSSRSSGGRSNRRPTQLFALATDAPTVSYTTYYSNLTPEEKMAKLAELRLKLQQTYAKYLIILQTQLVEILKAKLSGT